VEKYLQMAAVFLETALYEKKFSGNASGYYYGGRVISAGEFSGPGGQRQSGIGLERNAQRQLQRDHGGFSD
jgi:hypothetical protein